MSNIKQFFDREDVKGKFKDMLGKRAPAFITSVLQIATSSYLFDDVDPVSIYNSAAIAATLDLPLNNNLGFAWIVPYNGKAQFQIGWKGFVQLAQRTSQYKRINVAEVYANQFKSWNALTEELNADFTVEGSGDVVGYCAYFKMANGFEKLSFWSKEKVIKHAKKYSKTYQKKNNKGQLMLSPWNDEFQFDEMCKKTVLKNTLSKWGLLSVEMQTAIKVDQAVIDNPETEEVTYADATATEIKAVEFNHEELRIIDAVNSCKTKEELLPLKKQAEKFTGANEAFIQKLNSFNK